ncbi:MAG: hypothetical protein Q7S82_00670 [bacterium]|nr:hypothetical protein [bacterium]
MGKINLKKLISRLQDALIYEERSLISSQHDCYKNLPGNLSQKEVEEAREMLDTLLIQSLNHANVLGDLIIKYYEKSFKEL